MLSSVSSVVVSAQLVYISKELACIAFGSEPLWLVMSAGELCSELKDLAAFVVARGGDAR